VGSEMCIRDSCIVGTGKSIKYVCKDGPVFTLWDAMNTKGMI